MSELKPCPFCGSKRVGVHRHKQRRAIGYKAMCLDCGVSQTGVAYGDIEAAGEAWNRRAQPAQAGQVLTDDQWQRIADITQSILTRDIRDEIEAVLAKRGPQWLPIETAPKGQRVMVWIADKEVGENIAFAKVWFHSDGTLGGGAEGFNGKWDLTHWMPLPPPPGIVGEKGGAT